MNKITLNQIITENEAGLRLDQALAILLPQFSRSMIQQWILQERVTLDKKMINKCKQRVFQGQRIELLTELVDREEWQPEQIPLSIAYQDDTLLVINKPPGLVVHPGAGNPTATLVNALLHYDSQLKKLPRAGLIHRLDKDTSGLLLVARNLSAYHFLTAKMQARQINRTYLAIVSGTTPSSGTIDLPIGRHPIHRTKMAVLQQGGRSAITHYTLLEKLPLHSCLEVKLETGRTHQIRVHFSYLNFPILGDPLYGKVKNFTRLSGHLQQCIADFKRQALHAKQLEFEHPVTQETLSINASPPQDLQSLLDTFHAEGNESNS